MKSLLFALGLALCCLAQANQDKQPADIELSEIAGQWVFGAIVTNCQKMKDMISRMPASPISFKQQSSGDLEMTMEMATPHGCKTMRPVLKRENRVLTTTCGQGGKKTVEHINISGNFMLTDITVSHPKGQCKIVTLSVRDLSYINTKSLNELRAFANRYSLEGQQIHVLPTEGMCPRSS